MTLQQILSAAIHHQASDIHLTVGSPPCFRVNGGLYRLDSEKLMPAETRAFAAEMLDDEQMKRIEVQGEIDLSKSFEGLGRTRVNVYKQRGSISLALRVVVGVIPTFEQLGLPSVIRAISEKRRGLVLVTGPTGSGKSTTLAAMVDYINSTREEHIIAIEDPIEYLHKHRKSMINQREIGDDTKSFANALRASLRQDPDIILVGEMRDLETISTAITAAETGHLVLSTLHTIGAAKTIDRVIDVFPPHQQQQIRVQLASVLEAVVSQQLMPRADVEGRAAAFEIMISTPAVRNLIREGKAFQINTIIQTSSSLGMITMDQSLKEKYRRGIISLETFRKYAVDFEHIVQ